MLSRARQRGFTLVELLIVIAIIGIIVAVVFGTVQGCSRGGDKARESATEFARQMGEPFTGVTCVEMDSDGDGYVTCTVFRKEKDPLSIECARTWSRNAGCKMALAPVKAR